MEGKGYIFLNKLKGSSLSWISKKRQTKKDMRSYRLVEKEDWESNFIYKC